MTEPTYTDTDVDPTDADTVMRSGERAPGSPVPEHIERAIDNAAGKAAAEVAAYAREIGSQVAGSDATATQPAPVTAAGRAREAQGSKWATSEDPGDKVFVRDTAGDVEDTTADLRDPATTQQRPPEDVVPDVRDRVTPRLT